MPFEVSVRYEREGAPAVEEDLHLAAPEMLEPSESIARRLTDRFAVAVRGRGVHLPLADERALLDRATDWARRHGHDTMVAGGAGLVIFRATLEGAAEVPSSQPYERGGPEVDFADFMGGAGAAAESRPEPEPEPEPRGWRRPFTGRRRL